MERHWARHAHAVRILRKATLTGKRPRRVELNQLPVRHNQALGMNRTLTLARQAGTVLRISIAHSLVESQSDATQVNTGGLHVTPRQYCLGRATG